jgi:hypothetical protein
VRGAPFRKVVGRVAIVNFTKADHWLNIAKRDGTAVSYLKGDWIWA